jgi:small GTP-binding protein
MERPLKVVLVGPYRSGKSSLIKALTKDAISVERLGSSVSIDFGQITVGHQEINIFGTPGRRDFDFLKSIVGKGADACLLVLDATDGERLQEVKGLYEGLRTGTMPIIIVANKQDLEGAIHPDILRQVLDLRHEPVVGTSARTGEGLDVLVQTIIEVVTEE